MTALQTVRRARSIIIGAAVLRALILGIAVTYAVGAILGFVWFATSTLVEGPTLALISLAFGISSVVVLLWRERRALRVQQVALWLEQRIPRLEYALVTRVEQPRSDFAPAMDAIVARANVQRATLEGIRKPLLIAVIALLLASAFQYVSPSGPLMHMYPSGHPSVAIYGHESGGIRSRLDAIEARVTPPAYTSLPAVTLRDPSSINAFVGSAIVVRGNGSPAGIRAAAANSLSVARTGDGWSVSLAMPAQPAALRFTDGGFERVIVLAPQSDELPRVVLSSPVHDTALRTPRLTLQLVANASDDVGLQQGHFEYLVTSGAGEIFKSRTINTPAIQFNRDRSATMRATLDLSSLNLAEGDVVSMRAIVQDGNTLSGPGAGTSDTRTIRIIRASEYDSLAIEAAAPPPLDSSAVSQRMLVMMAEKLVKDQPKIARTELVNRSNEIGDLEDRVRRRVGEILSNEETGGEPMQPGDTAPQLEESEPADAGGAVVNKDLHAAYNSLWQAVRALKIADPGTALPPMRSALA
ncbi:MAG TPA: DUF4175 family protein, partial [Gemmatimonadaceae bacterium]|nr:DUF4175 family protein [Gemmatimonadaceae bacterium]